MVLKSRVAIALSCAVAVLMTAQHAFASMTWGAATGISGDSDVSTAGTLVGAFNVGTQGVSGATVNGVNFDSFAVTAGVTTVGNFTLQHLGAFNSNNTIFGSALPPFSSLSPSYQTLLQSATRATGGDFILTMNGLTPGQTYTFQWWDNNSNVSPTTPVLSRYTTNAFDGSFVSLSNNTGTDQGGLGQYAIGTFTAGATGIEVIQFSGAIGLPQINAFQLRTTVVPVPAAIWTGLATLGVMGGMTVLRRRRKAGK
jgi:hypothetical protein